MANRRQSNYGVLGDSVSTKKPNIPTRLNLLTVILAKQEESIYKVDVRNALSGLAYIDNEERIV